MANIELKPSRQREIPKEENETYEEFGEIESDCMPDDSDEDPSFDILEETRSKLSKISLEKSRPRKVKKIDPESEFGEESFGVEIPELDEKDGKCFEKVEELIKDGHLEKLKVDQCKVYLRKYGLRLTGNRGVLIERIREHLEVINGGGEKKYPASSFVLNCKGDACMGDVVMFEQNVYEMFSIASRSATGPPCGTRIVTGRIVKESYGAAKQQHTFTIEVLWSRGEKPLPPLHPLLIKGRNLYRLKTMRQKWADEEERRKVLQEKHARGSLARCSRENRIQEKEMSKLGRMKRMTENKSDQHRVNPIQTKVVQQENIQHLQQLHHHQKEISQNLPKPQGLQISFDKPLISIQGDNNAQVSKPHCQFRANNDSSRALKPWNYEFQQGLPRPHFHDNHHRYQPHRLSPHSLSYTEPLLSPPRQQNWVQQRQWCQLYRQGRCYYGDNCKYRHN